MMTKKEKDKVRREAKAFAAKTAVKSSNRFRIVSEKNHKALDVK